MSCSLLCRDPENAEYMLKSGVVLKFAATVSSTTSAEALENLCKNNGDCRKLLCESSFVSDQLLPCCTEKSNTSAFSILRLLAQEPSFPSNVSGVCGALLMSPLIDENMLTTLSKLSPVDLYREGALTVATNTLMNENNTTRMRVAAITLIHRISLSVEAFSSVIAVENMVSLLLHFPSANVALVLLERLLCVPSHRQAFLDLKGLETIIKQEEEVVFADACTVCLRVLRDFSHNPGDGSSLAAFAKRILTSASSSDVAKVFALDLLKELMNYNTCILSVRNVVRDPEVSRTIVGSPLLSELFRFYFEKKLMEV